MKKKSKKKNIKKRRRKIAKKVAKKNTAKKKSRIKKKKPLKFKAKRIKKKRSIKKRTTPKSAKSKRGLREIIIRVLRFKDRFKVDYKINLNIDKTIQSFFQGISDKIDVVRDVIQEEKERKKQLKIKEMQLEKLEAQKQSKLEKQFALELKEKEFKNEIKIERERKKELQKFIRLEQAEVRKEQAAKQRKFLEQIKLEKKIEQFRKREALEIKNLEKFVLNQERESYSEVQSRIDTIKEKYQALRDQKIRERVEQLGVKVDEGDDRSILLEKEKQYNISRQKIEFALESFYRSAHSLCFQINKRYIPKYLSIMRVIDRRFETGEIFIKWDDAPDEEWLILIYIKDNSPEKGIIIEDKTNIQKNISHEFQSNEIFKASDMMVDSLTKLLDVERKKRATN